MILALNIANLAYTNSYSPIVTIRFDTYEKHVCERVLLNCKPYYRRIAGGGQAINIEYSIE